MNSSGNDSKQTAAAREGKGGTGLPWLIVFDLDGTLIDSSLDLANSVNAALAHIGRSPLSAELVSSFVGDGAATLVQRALRYGSSADTLKADVSFPEAFAYFLDFYREHKLDNTRTYTGVVEALRTIRARLPHVLMAVLTNKPVRPSREICDQLGLSPFFFANYGGNSFATKKPAPEGLQRIIAEARALQTQAGADPASLAPSGAFMIGDSAVDVVTARACGLRCIGCTYGLAPESLQTERPDHLVSSPIEWIRALGL